MPVPSWSDIITTSTSDITALQDFVNPIYSFVFSPIIVFGVLALGAGLLLYLVHGRK